VVKLEDRIAGTVKEIVGEIVGDGKLAEEGALQKKDRNTPQSEKRDQAPNSLTGARPDV
jgi:hypothetical protein